MTDKVKFYNDVNPNPDFAEIEAKILQKWEENHIFLVRFGSIRGNP